VAHAAEERDLVLFEAHAWPAAEPEPAPGQLAADLVDRDRQARREALDDGHQASAVGFAGGEVPEHGTTIPI
jgi:hypothetical protein